MWVNILIYIGFIVLPALKLFYASFATGIYLGELHHICIGSTEDGKSTSVFSLYGQLSQGRMADFPAFIASKSFDL